MDGTRKFESISSRAAATWARYCFSCLGKHEGSDDLNVLRLVTGTWKLFSIRRHEKVLI